MYRVFLEILSFVALRPLSLVYELVIFYRNWLYDSQILKQRILPGRVVSVGNIEVGGAGKTPLVKYIADELISQKHLPAILTRGYRSGLKGRDFAVFKNGKMVFPSKLGYDIYPDEAVYLSHALENVPIVVGKYRFENAMSYYPKHSHISHWILEDGFQHRKIHRDIDIVVLSEALESRAFQSLLPYGLLREEIGSLSRADIVVLRGKLSEGLVKTIKGLKNPSAAIVFSKYVQSSPVQVLGSKNAETKNTMIPSDFLLVSAVANNQRVLDGLEAKGMTVKKTLLGRDHKKFRFRELDQASKGVSAIVTTSKDYYRQKVDFDNLPVDIYLVELNVLIQEKNLFFEKM